MLQRKVREYGGNTEEGSMAVMRRFGGVVSKKRAFIVSVGALLAVLGAVVFGFGWSGAASCTDDAIMKCGFSSKSEFIQRVEANDNGVNGQADLQAIYAHYGLSSSDYGDFEKNAVPGVAKRNGDIVVDGQVVGTGGMNLGRLKSTQGSGASVVAIGAHDYYANTNDRVFATTVSQLPIYALFDSTGTLKFAVMTTCGNPQFPKVVVKTAAACKILNASQTDAENTYAFTADATHMGNATIDYFVYDFGDGSATVQQMSGATPVTHTYTAEGTFTAKVTVFATFPGTGGTPRALPAIVECTKQITVQPKPVPPTPVTPVVPPVTPPTPPPAPPVQVLPNTGAGSVVTMFSLVTFGGFLGYRFILTRRLRSKPTSE